MKKINFLRYKPYIVIFIVNFCIMSFELVIGRMIAPFVGVSLYTWTAVIGMVLLGMTLGSYYGGKIADKYASEKILAILLVFAGIFSITIPLYVQLIAPNLTFLYVVYMLQVILTTGLFILPFIFLGTISPLLIKLTLKDLKDTGNIVGTMSALSAFGSIIGTFITGFFLISHFGTHGIITMIALILIVLGLSFTDPKMVGQFIRKKFLLIFLLVMLFIISFYFFQTKNVCQKESDYYCIRIINVGDSKKILVLDQLTHSITNLKNPADLEYHYLKLFAIFYDYKFHKNIKSLFIGGGAYTLPRYIADKYKNHDSVVVEIDPLVSHTAFTQFDVNPRLLKNVNNDARLFLKELPQSEKYDIIYGDAFSSVSVPYHLTTKEFGQMVKNHLKEDGIYVVNLIDQSPFGDFVNSYTFTLSHNFKYTYVLTETSNRRLKICRETYVVVASQEKLNQKKFSQLAKNLGYEKTYSILTPDQLAKLSKTTDQILLTDDFAPVDNMLAAAASGCQLKVDALLNKL